jgi:hypothetical protein
MGGTFMRVLLVLAVLNFRSWSNYLPMSVFKIVHSILPTQLFPVLGVLRLYVNTFLFVFILMFNTGLVKLLHVNCISVVLFRVVTSYSDVVGYRRFGGPCCPHLYG